MRVSSVRLTSRSRKLSATRSCTYTREQAEHLWPFMPNAER